MTEITEAIAAELRLLDPAVRADPAAVEALLAPDFSEIGQSGRIWSRDATIAALAHDPGTPAQAAELTGRVVAPGLVLVSYASTGSSGVPVRRTSLWRKTADGWQIAFHQGTPTAT